MAPLRCQIAGSLAEAIVLTWYFHRFRWRMALRGAVSVLYQRTLDAMNDLLVMIVFFTVLPSLRL